MKIQIKRIPRLLIALLTLCCSSPLLANAVVEPGTQPVWGIGGFTLKEPNLALGATKAYRSWFENGAWLGDLIEYDVTANGTRSTDVDPIGGNPAVDGTLNWSARYEFDIKENPTAANPPVYTDYWKTGRKIITHNGTQQVAFRFDTISAAQRIELDPDTTSSASYDSPLLNFIRGDRSKDSPDGIFRARYGLFGDTGKVQPLYIGAPTVAPLIAGHAQYKSDNINRAGRVVVAANDGMVHVFDAATGIEEYAYVPSMLFSKLNELTTLIISAHKAFADGQLTSADAKIGPTWKTLVAGGLGAGAKGLFALDVTSPTLTAETSTAAADQKVLWEMTGDAFGYIHGEPTIAPRTGGTWYVISGNGYGSTTGTAQLLMVPVSGGTPVTIATNATIGNGLSAPALLDTNGDGTVDIAYAGDLLGNMWKFDLNNPGTAATLLFAAGASKPITTKPDVALHPHGGLLVYFGTGSLLSNTDATDTSNLQSVYAIWDYPGRTTAVTDGTVTIGLDTFPTLLPQTLSVETYDFTKPDTTVISRSVRTATSNTPNWSYHKGWKVDLASGTGERVINNVTVRANRLQFVTDRPSTDSDHPTGESWLLELHWLNGGDINSIFFDLSTDGDLNNDDKVTLADASLVVPIGISMGLGNRSKPTFGRIGNGVDTIFINGVDLANFSCSGSCAGGLQGGHFDVDTDLALGGGTSSHKHEYDDSYDVTYVDYFDILDGNDVDVDAGISLTEPFVVILANADFSNQGKLKIGTKEWNVVDYQEMIQARLTAYDGTDTSTLVDNEGASLVFTLQGILDAGGTMSTTFDYDAIITGGLHPSKTGCVGGHDAYDTHGRWRNGAYTFQMIKLSTILAGSATGNSWIGQTPVDLATGMVGGGMHGNPANTSGFLYESTIFWHWSDVVASAVLDTGGGMCYGEEGWYDAKRVETGGITTEEFSALFPNFALQQDYITSLADQLLAITCEKGSGILCEKEDDFKALAELLKPLVGDVKDFLELWPLIRGGGSAGVGAITDGSQSEVGGDGDDDEEVEFTGTPTGRISWIDLRS